MAFERPIEADRVDDFSLIGTFIRAPVVGTLMWILGGNRAREEEEEQSRVSTSEEGNSPSNPLYGTSRRHKKMPLKGMPPKTTNSDVSEFTDGVEMMDGRQLFTQDMQQSFGKKKKELSWSDENGRELVQILGDQSGPSREIVSRPAVDVKSDGVMSLTRTRSVQSHLEHREPEKSYLPRGLDGNHNGIIFPAPYTSDVRNPVGSVESPSWGWYVRTTPPTPEMYASKLPSTKTTQPNNISYSSAVAALDAQHSNQRNRVFQDLQGSNKTALAPFPSVPL